MSRLTVPVRADDHILGPEHAPVTLIEYGDFECPYCGQAHLALKELLAELGTQIRFVFRHFPLTQIHPNAETAALAAEAAGEQGRFWEMHDTLYENQTALEDEDLLQYARDVGLDLVKFDESVGTERHLDRIRLDFMSGARSGVNGTPTFFINGERHNGSYEYPVLSRAIREAAGVRPAR
jgi:protein-disulfide isomerase